MAVVMTFSHYCQWEKSNARPQNGDLVWKMKIRVQEYQGENIGFKNNC